jgi:Protein kinase domain
MLTDGQTLWTDERIQATLNGEYVVRQFKPDQRDLLTRSPSFGDGLTNDTYLDWILERARRLFLILVHVGVPDKIFGLVDESFDDDDLPVAASAVKDLKLSAGQDSALDKKFYKAQFRFLVRNIKQGDHIRFLDGEIVPVKHVLASSGISRVGKDGIERVYMASNLKKIYGRKKVTLDQPPIRLTEADILSEINSAKSLAHEHVLSVYGSYLDGNSVYILLRPAVEYTLNLFLNNPPKHFENLPKVQRREILCNWPHCLANGLAWLHNNGRHHGAIRPSNIVIDIDFRIFLAQIDGLSITQGNTKVSDIESYQYAAPERWKRAATMQTKAPPTLTLPSGGRSGRKYTSAGDAVSAASNDGHDSWATAPTLISPGLPMETSNPTSTSYPFLPNSKRNAARRPDRFQDKPEYAGSASLVTSGTGPERLKPQISSRHSDHPSRNRPGTSTSAAHSQVSSHSSDAGQNLRGQNYVTVAPSEIKTALVQTWHTGNFDPYPADTFSLGAIVLEIITFLCKRSSSAFSRHRSAKNRTAGRGGGIADASFHANLGQVHSWSTSLEQEAKKKATKEDGKMFKAVGPILDISRECLVRSPEDRPDSDMVEEALERYIEAFTSSGKTHCKFKPPSEGNLAGYTKSAAHSRSTNLVTTGAALGKETGRTLKPRGSALKSNVAKSHGPPDSLASFDFDYGQDARGNHEVDNRDQGDGSRATGYSPEDDIIDLQSIADRPDRLQNGTDISSWSHVHTESRASYYSSDTNSNSLTERQLIDSFFLPESRPPSMMPKPLQHGHTNPTPSQQSYAQSHLSNTARKRITPDVIRQHLKSPTLDSTREQGVGPLGTQRKSGSSTDSTRQRHSVLTPELLLPQRKSGSSTDSAKQRHSVIGISDMAQARHSVSTLASNTSTLRLSWHQRAISPMSNRGADKNTEPVGVVGQAVSTDEDTEDDHFIHAQSDDNQPPDEQRQPPGRAGSATGPPMSQASREQSGSLRPADSKRKGKDKAESTDSARVGPKQRYTVWRGRM